MEFINTQLPDSTWREKNWVKSIWKDKEKDRERNEPSQKCSLQQRINTKPARFIGDVRIELVIVVKNESLESCQIKNYEKYKTVK